MNRNARWFGFWVGLLSVGWCGLAAVQAQVDAKSVPRTEVSPEKPIEQQPAASPTPGNLVTTQAATTQPTDWIEASKHPFPWFTWGADFRIRDEYLNNVITFDKNDPTHERNWARYRPRWWATVTPIPQIELNTRIIWEARSICEPEVFQSFDGGDVLFDKMNVTLKKPFDLPFTLVAGRQEIILGDTWLVLDGTPLDGSRTLYFDAVRATFELEPIKTTVEAIAIDQYADHEHWFDDIHTNREEKWTGQRGPNYVTEQNERGAILWLTNKSITRTQLDGYFIYKNDDRVARTGNSGDIYTFGGMVTHDFDEHWKIRSDTAVQFGKKNDRDLCAMGSLNRLSYDFKDKHKNQLRMDYEYESGDHPSTPNRDEQFDVLWGRFPRFSELWIYANAGETRVGDPSNMHRVAWGWTVKPTEPSEVAVDYHLLFADTNALRGRPGFSDSGCFRGQLITSAWRYTFTKQLKGHIIAEFFFPGDYTTDARNDVATFLRAELLYSW